MVPAASDRGRSLLWGQEPRNRGHQPLQAFAVDLLGSAEVVDHLRPWHPGIRVTLVVRQLQIRHGRAVPIGALGLPQVHAYIRPRTTAHGQPIRSQSCAYRKSGSQTAIKVLTRRGLFTNCSECLPTAELRLGPGLAFIGRQVHFDVCGEDFYADLLFFHVEQLRYVVIELKTGNLKPEHAGQLQFYVALVEDRLRRTTHAPTVGILVCGSRNDRIVRYALNLAGAPLAVSTFSYATLPAAEQEALPSEDDLTAALVQIPDDEEDH